jgi:hypothetical protein
MYFVFLFYFSTILFWRKISGFVTTGCDCACPQNATITNHTLISILNNFSCVFKRIVTYPEFAWLIRRVLYLMIESIGPLYNWLRQFANHCLTHCHLLPTGHSTGTILTSNWTPLCSFNFLSIFLVVPSYNSSARTTENTVLCYEECLLIGPLANDGCPSIFERVTLAMCLQSRCVAMGICVTVL